jgi:tRNA(Ile2)-agmatinylcytidine synthase
VTIVGLDDTDSRDRGMCTTYLATRIAEDLQERGASVRRLVLARLNPAVEHKTRGNAALAIHTDSDAETAERVATDWVADGAVLDARSTNPGVVVAPMNADDLPDRVCSFSEDAVQHHHEVASTRSILDELGWRNTSFGNGRGLIGALAAVGAWNSFDDPTFEVITYRFPDRRGTPRSVDRDSLFDAADSGYPTVWDTVDRGADEAVCVPNTPGPILFGIRGDRRDAVREVAEAIESEPIERQACFVTNQGTDAHLRDGTIDAVQDDHAYRLDGCVLEPPRTREGGHVHVVIGEDTTRLPCVAFEPTKRFRDYVRSLRSGDQLTVCGEVSQGTLKLEKFAVRSLTRAQLGTPTCAECGRTMESAGQDQGYRCRECETTAGGKVTVPLQRDLEIGWYEVPPRARRHIAKPLVRGGFDAQTHPER